MHIDAANAVYGSRDKQGRLKALSLQEVLENHISARKITAPTGR